jgi:hypothetical protein
MSNFNLLTITLFPNATTNSTTLTLSQTTAVSNSYSSAMQYVQQTVKAGGLVDDSGRWIPYTAIACVVIS